MLDGQAKQRANDILGAFSMKPQDVEDRKDGVTMVLNMEFEKGVRVGLLMARDMPRAILEHVETMAEEVRFRQAREKSKQEENE